MPRARPTALLVLAALVLCAALLGACGKKDDSIGQSPGIGKKGDDAQAAQSLGFPTFATKNTTRVGGGDPTADAAGVAQAVYSGGARELRPPAVTLVDSDDWQAGIAAAVFMSSPVRAPILLSDGGDLPEASAGALAALAPTGAAKLGGVQVIRVGDVAKVKGAKVVDVEGKGPYATAAAIDTLRQRAAGSYSDRVVVTTGERSEFAMPAAAWAAKSGDAILYTKRDGIPAETVTALKRHQQPKIYVLGPPSTVSDKVLGQLRKLGTVTRVGAKDAVSNAIAFARFIDGRFGWGVVDPGHGLVFADAARPLDAAAAAPLSASGKYGPLLLSQRGTLPLSLQNYLLDIQPGYERDPVRGVYNHAWIIGDDEVISVAEQGRIDALLEIVPVRAQSSPAPGRPSS